MDADVKALLLLEVGDSSPPTIAPVMNQIWNSFADKAATFPRLQELYVKRRMIDIRLQTLSDSTDFSMDGALMLRLSQRTKYLTDRRKETIGEIDRLEGIARANRSGAVAKLDDPTLLPEDADRYRGAPINRDELNLFTPIVGGSQNA